MALRCAVLRWRLAGKSFKDAIELRKRLKSRGERDVADGQIWVSQEVTGSFEPSVREIFDKIYASNLFEIFAQMIRVHADRLSDFSEGKLFS